MAVGRGAGFVQDRSQALPAEGDAPRPLAQMLRPQAEPLLGQGFPHAGEPRRDPVVAGGGLEDHAELAMAQLEQVARETVERGTIVEADAGMGTVRAIAVGHDVGYPPCRDRVEQLGQLRLADDRQCLHAAREHRPDLPERLLLVVVGAAEQQGDAMFGEADLHRADLGGEDLVVESRDHGAGDVRAAPGQGAAGGVRHPIECRRCGQHALADDAAQPSRGY